MSPVPFPIGLIGGTGLPTGGQLTKVEFTVQHTIGTVGGGFENETDSDGGISLQNYSFGSPPSSTISQDLSWLNLNWDDRYNYRLGFANIYSVSNIKLYRNGALTETQSGTHLSLSNVLRHCGINIDPTNRNITTTAFGTNISYPKSELLTKVEFTCRIKTCDTHKGGGVENGTGGSGGTNIETISFTGAVPNFTGEADLSSDNIAWSNRYNYRLGFANVYQVSDIKLYKSFVLTETQSGNAYSISDGALHAGTNLNPSSRNNTNISLGSCLGYPK